MRALAAVAVLALAGCHTPPPPPSSTFSPRTPPKAAPTRHATARSAARSRAAPPPSASARAAGRTCPGDAARDILARVNAARAAAGMPPLHQDSHLARAASARAASMARQGRLSHSGWEQEIRRTGCTARSLGENVASGYRTSAAVMDGWLHSRAHRANILHPGFRSIGIGCATDRSGTLWWTQDFAG